MHAYTLYATLSSLLLITIILWLWHAGFFNRKKKGPYDHEPFNLVRAVCNPIRSPHHGEQWEAQGTFNPAAIMDDTGTVHLLYRAISDDGVSRLGYLSSKDGVTFDAPMTYPVYEHLKTSDTTVEVKGPKEFNPDIYTSGGGWDGCEDPRAVLIDGVVYMTYIAFGGWDSIRIALTSISLDHLKNLRWDWKRHRIISPSGEVHKNWMLFPEKINGKFAFLHSISPEIMIEYVDNVDELSLKPIKSRPPYDEHHRYFGRKEYWDTSVRGAGPPPIKTKDGWLLLYHSMDKRDPNKYKLGAMLLDLDDPTKVLYRSPLPILSPDEHYENNYKPGVIYASGAVVKKQTLYVYYGGGDMHLCVAHTSLRKLLAWLKKHGAVK